MIARIVWTILRYPVGAEVGFADEFTTEYRTVMGYHYAHGAFYVLFSEGNMVHMNQLDKLVLSLKIKTQQTLWMLKKNSQKVQLLLFREVSVSKPVFFRGFRLTSERTRMEFISPSTCRPASTAER